MVDYSDNQSVSSGLNLKTILKPYHKWLPKNMVLSVTHKNVERLR